MSLDFSVETFLENVVFEITDIPSTEELARPSTGPPLAIMGIPKEIVATQELEDVENVID